MMLLFMMDLGLIIALEVAIIMELVLVSNGIFCDLYISMKVWPKWKMIWWWKKITFSKSTSRSAPLRHDLLDYQVTTIDWFNRNHCSSSNIDEPIPPLQKSLFCSTAHDRNHFHNRLNLDAECHLRPSQSGRSKYSETVIIEMTWFANVCLSARWTFVSIARKRH